MLKYIKMRNDILEKVKSELIGPGSDAMEVDIEQELLTEDPLQRYSVGILYPQKMKQKDNIDDINDTADNNISTIADDDEAYDRGVNTSNEYYPSAIGMSFYVSGVLPQINIDVKAATYHKVKEATECEIYIEDIPVEIQEDGIFNSYLYYEENVLSLKRIMEVEDKNQLQKIGNYNDFKKGIDKLYYGFLYGWKRLPIKDNIVFSPKDQSLSKKNNYNEIEVCKGLKVGILARPDIKNNLTVFTVSLINTNEVNEETSQRKAEKSFLQVGLSISIIDESNNFVENKKNSIITEKENSIELLYRNKKSYGIGHGCAMVWNSKSNDIPEKISTSVIPSYEVPQMEFDIENIQGKAREILQMKNLSAYSSLSREEVIDYLRAFSRSYITWIEDQKKKIKNISVDLQEVATKNMADCRCSWERMEKGIDLLEKDDDIYKTFTMANEAMLMQRLHADFQSKKRFPGEKQIIWPVYKNVIPKKAAWRPFQLAFFLLSLDGLSNSSSKDRDLVDLIWFPTGGGKTEAYLGISAFTIFLRRFRYPEKGKGSAILMRYTLRLLTAQQFQRASTLILACELIRRKNREILGDEPISIGLWIGSNSTPNKVDIAFSKLRTLQVNEKAENPFQVLSCPWCGTRMIKEKGKGSLGYMEGIRPKRLKLYCPETSCEFHDELPIRIVDEDIYRNPPTLLFSTVDKFALMPWKKEVSRLFAIDNGNNLLSPELIIQDELHLISGPLGTIVGLYESAIDELCSIKGLKPKIISSTATIRRAKEQGKALYNREIIQFPAPAINAEDSFFAREASIYEKPGRLYTGIMSAGRTSTTTLIRSMASILQVVKELQYPEEIKDKYWTLTGYFNSIRELGKTSTLANDDIKDHIRRISTRHNTERRVYYEPEELTSRKQANEIPVILEKMEISYPDKEAIDILLASNMISVGIDVYRLGLMTVVGQPKTTSEYIQATSRIGRNYPGIVFTLYNGTRPRDRSHYEGFLTYHQSLYRYVEPTSVTPFSKPARERALKGVLVSLMRHYVGWRKDNQLQEFDPHNSKFMEVISKLVKRVESIEPRERDSIVQELEKIKIELQKLLKYKDDLVYANEKKESLLYPAGNNGKHWPTLQSMRNVDNEVEAKIKEYINEEE